MAEFGFVTQKDRDEARRLRSRVDALDGGGGDAPRRPNHPGGGDQPWDTIWIKVTGNTQDGTKKRWKYDWVQVVKSSAGYDGWTTLTGGLSGHDSTWGYAYNTVEDINAATGTWGNGVASTNLTGTITIKAVPNNVILRAWIVYPTDSGSLPEVWFQYENGIDGGCT